MIGAMIKYGDYCSYGADEIVSALEAANNNPNIEAIILNVDGPGGSVSSIGPFQQFAAKKQKPIVGYYDECCSAHLYAMLLVSDYVMAQNDVSAQIGSVGVVLSWADNQKYLEKAGYTFHEVYPKESEHKNEAFRLAMEGNYELIKEEMLSPIAIKFQEAVKQATGAGGDQAAWAQDYEKSLTDAQLTQVLKELTDPNEKSEDEKTRDGYRTTRIQNEIALRAQLKADLKKKTEAVAAAKAALDKAKATETTARASVAAKTMEESTAKDGH